MFFLARVLDQVAMKLHDKVKLRESFFFYKRIAKVVRMFGGRFLGCG
jgi:hypothetical protein